MAVQRVAALGRLACGPDVETGRVGDVNVLIGTFGYAAADNGEVLFLVAAGRVCVDEGCATGLQIAVADDAGFDVKAHEFSPLEFGTMWAGHTHIPGGRLLSLCARRLCLCTWNRRCVSDGQFKRMLMQPLCVFYWV